MRNGSARQLTSHASRSDERGCLIADRTALAHCPVAQYLVPIGPEIHTAAEREGIVNIFENAPLPKPSRSCEWSRRGRLISQSIGPGRHRFGSRMPVGDYGR